MEKNVTGWEAKKQQNNVWDEKKITWKKSLSS